MLLNSKRLKPLKEIKALKIGLNNVGNRYVSLI